MATKTNSYNDRGSTCVSALKNLYVAMGGELTDTYNDIAGGEAVSNLTIIPDCVNALSKKATSGGGGSSDFSTATVTIVNTNENDNVLIYGAFAYEENEVGPGAPAMTYAEYRFSETGTEVFSVVLYKGSAFINIAGAEGTISTSVSGDGELMGASVVATGNCTITVSEGI